MDVDYPDDSYSMRFCPITFAIETAPAEAIALADIAQGATNAAVQQDRSSKDKTSKNKAPNPKKRKGKGSLKDKETDMSTTADCMTPEDEACTYNFVAI
jgi:hypothetical protein